MAYFGTYKMMPKRPGNKGVVSCEGNFSSPQCCRQMINHSDLSWSPSKVVQGGGGGWMWQKEVKNVEEEDANPILTNK